jgi:hypothetical protein
MPYPDVISDAELADTQHQVKMAYANIILYDTFSRVDDGDANLHPFANSVTKEKPIQDSFEKRWEESD